MLITVPDLLNALRDKKIQEHLNTNIELKESWSNACGRKISALANRNITVTSWLLVGVNDEGEATGKTSNWAKNEEEKISQNLNRNLDPFLSCQNIHCLETPSGYILAIEISNPGDVVCWDKYPYKGAGTTIARMEPSEAIELRLTLPGLHDFSKRTTETITYQKRLLLPFYQKFQEQKLDFEAVSSGAEALRSLKIDQTETANILFGNIKFRLVRFTTEDNVDINEQSHGLYELLTDRFIEKLQRLGAYGRPNAPYPPRALKEAIANAVAHTAYFEQQGDIVIEIQPEYICISNICLEESTFFANKWFSRSHHTVNGLLMETLRMLGHVDELGRGKSLIYLDSILNGKKPPEVKTEKLSRYCRWSTYIDGIPSSSNAVAILQRMEEIYKNKKEALIASSLIYWSMKDFDQLNDQIDKSFEDTFVNVPSHPNCPVVYLEETGMLHPKRWIATLAQQGQISKALSTAENRRVLAHLYIQHEETKRDFTPKEAKAMVGMSNTNSENRLIHRMLNKWITEGWIKRRSRGKYYFTKPVPNAKEMVEAHITKLKGDSEQ